MTILGRLIDKQTVSRAGDGLAGATMTTAPHSLPATNPEMVLPILRSVQSAQVGVPILFAPGGNASILTLGFSGSGLNSLGSFPTVMFDVIAQVFHSYIR